MNNHRYVFPLLLALGAQPLSAQYKAEVTITGGSHAGSYVMTPGTRKDTVTCSLHQNIIAGLDIKLVEPRVKGDKKQLATLAIRFANEPLAIAKGTKVFDFGLSFGDDSTSRPGIYYSSDTAPLPQELGTLTFEWVYLSQTFKLGFSANVRDGSDVVRIQGTMACKGVNIKDTWSPP